MSLGFYHWSHKILTHVVFNWMCWFCEFTGVGHAAFPSLNFHSGGREQSSRPLYYLGRHCSSSSHIALSLLGEREVVSSSTWRDSLTFPVIRTWSLWFNLWPSILILCIQLCWLWGYLCTSKFTRLKFYEQRIKLSPPILWCPYLLFIFTQNNY